MGTSKTIRDERGHVLPALTVGAPFVPIADLPDVPGLYALWAATSQTIESLGLSEVEGQVPLLERPLYVGKAEGSILHRLSKDHFASGDTGHSTVRRTFAALLDLESRPRHSRIAQPSERQLRVLTANFDLVAEADEHLSAWMVRSLVVRAAPTSWVPLKDLERAVGAVLCPPLDQERVPMWSPNPWRDQVAAARERLRGRAREFRDKA
jgi:hypothetical protein